MLTIPVEDIRAKDYSPEFGTVEYLRHEGDTVYLRFKNGVEIYRSMGEEMEIQQGGR